MMEPLVLNFISMLIPATRVGCGCSRTKAR